MINVKNGSLYQWDLNRKIEVLDPEGKVIEIHCCHEGDEEAFLIPFTQEGDKLEAVIPNVLLQSEKNIKFFLVSKDENEIKTIICKELEVVYRQKPSNYVYEESEIFNYTQLINEVEETLLHKADLDESGKLKSEQIPDNILKDEDLTQAVNTALAQAKESGEFRGDKGDTGSQGIQGEKGDKGDTGADGVPCTHFWNGTSLTVTSASGTSTADLKGEKGDKGDKGDQGLQGVQGIRGEKGDKGDTGEKGADGQNGLDATPVTPLFVDSVEECTDTTKPYVLPDGYIWIYTSKETVVGGYTNRAEPLPDNTTDTSKWVNGQRFSSSGISAQSGTTVSNEISCKNGDVIRIKGVSLRSSADRLCILATSGNVYNYWNNATNGCTCELTNGVYVVTITNANATGFRFAMPTPSDASAVIVTVNEEIVEPTVIQESGWVNTNHAFVPNDYDEEFVAINDNINRLNVDAVNLKTADNILKDSIDEIEAKLEKIAATEIPDYWKSHIENKIATIKNLHRQYGKDCFSFVLMADTHYGSHLSENTPLLAKKIMDEADIKYAIHVGDWQTRDCKETKIDLLTENAAIEAMFAPIRDRLLMQQGNHDGAYGTVDGTTYVHDLTPQEMHEFVYRKVGMIGNVHFDETGTAYYIDDTSNNVRYIGLNTQCNDYELNADGTQKYPKMCLMRFTQPQFDFLINEALKENVTNKTKIVIFAHVPTTQEIGDSEVMNGVLNAYVNRTTYSGSYAGEYDYDAVSVNVDFTDVKGKLVGYFHGHNHIDSVNTDNSFKIIGTRCDAKEENDAALKAERVKGTTTEQSFDVFTVTNDTIYATKIGAGSDRTVSY